MKTAAFAAVGVLSAAGVFLVKKLTIQAEASSAKSVETVVEKAQEENTRQYMYGIESIISGVCISQDTDSEVNKLANSITLYLIGYLKKIKELGKLITETSDHDVNAKGDADVNNVHYHLDTTKRTLFLKIPTKEVVESMKKHGVTYFAAVGGAASLIAKSVKKYEVIAYEDLGPEALAELTVEDFPCIVVIDSEGTNFYEEGQKPYRKL